MEKTIQTNFTSFLTKLKKKYLSIKKNYYLRRYKRRELLSIKLVQLVFKHV